MGFGIDAKKYLADWALENSEELVDNIEQILHDGDLEDIDKSKAVYTKTLNFVFAAISEAIEENNSVIEKQLRRAGVNLPFFDNDF